MRKYLVNEMEIDEHGIEQHVVNEYSEEWIMENYWPYWKEKMDQKFGENYYLTIPETCIEDWVTVNWAWEKP